MTDYYVNSAAAGANDGTSKADAWTSIFSIEGTIAAGDRLFVSRAHNQNPGASASLDFPTTDQDNPVLVYFIDFSDDSYNPASAANFSGASSDIIITGVVQIFGLYNGVADDTTHVNDSQNNRPQKYVDYTFAGGDDLTFVGAYTILWFERSTFTHVAGTLQQHRLEDNHRCRFEGCTWTGTPGTMEIDGSSQGGYLDFDACDVSIFSTLFAHITSCTVALKRCKLHADVLPTIGAFTSRPNDSAIVENSAAGAITEPPVGLNKFVDFHGDVYGDMSVYRDSGASDGINPYSWRMTAGVRVIPGLRAFRAPPIAVFVDPDASISGATGRGVFTSTRCATLGTPAALTSDSSTWTGGDIDTKYKIDVSLSNGSTLTVYLATDGITLTNDTFWLEVSEPDQVGGPVVVRACSAASSAKIYVDPSPVIDGTATSRQWFSGGMQVCEEGEADWFAQGVQVSNDQAGGGGGGANITRFMHHYKQLRGAA